MYYFTFSASSFSPTKSINFCAKSDKLSDDSGIYIENCTYEKLQALLDKSTKIETSKVIEPIKKSDANPFSSQEENKEW